MRLFALLLAAVVVLTTSGAQPAELVMLRRAGCPWCAAFDREVGPIYPKTEMARLAPLRVLDIDAAGTPEGLSRPVRYTPTFVLMAEGREVGRIEGYPGNDFFWALIDRLLAKLPKAAQPASAPT